MAEGTLRDVEASLEGPPIFERVMARGETVHLQDQIFCVNRQGDTEDACFTLSHNPIRDESGKVGGMLMVLMETTGYVLLQQQLRANKILEVAVHKRTERALKKSRE